MENHYLERILTSRVYDVAVETPLEQAPGLSKRCGNNILLKREDLQPVFSFKIRGAYNKMSRLSAEELKRGVVAASAGNHAQGVALSACMLGCEATIFMPQTTPQIKVNAVTERGAKAVLIGDSYSDAYLHAMEFMNKTGAVFIHPYDDPDVIAGQGTIGIEIVRQCRQKIDAIFIPVGGGGLIAGVAACVKRLLPETRIIGVEPVDSNAMQLSLEKGERVTLQNVGLFADGVAVKQVGEETFRLCQQFVDEIVLVDTDAICAAIKDVFEDTRSILEPAGALAVAGAKLYAEREGVRDQTFVTILSGANMNFDRLRHVSERSELGEKREAIIAAVIPETPGSFRTFCALIGNRNITEFNYRYGDDRMACIFVGIHIQDSRETQQLIELFSQNGIKAHNLTDNETAKLHIRHLVGGHAPQVENERLYRFIFPERPGALTRFLDQMRIHWNISLFHYRNHGADFGRILAGMQVPEEDNAEFQNFLDELGYDYTDETENLACKLFL